jgi:threonine/homoserine/homoserine lactone efflux protein
VSIELVSFAVIATLLVIAPGQDTMLTLRNASTSGFRCGLETSLGICCGLFLHATLSAVGLSALFVASSSAFGLLRIAGAAYLAWLAVESFVRARESFRVESRSVAVTLIPQPRSFGKAFRQGFLSNALNPKTTTFYLAVLPQFVRTPETALFDSLLLAAVHFLISIAWLSLLSVAAASGRDLLSRLRVSAAFHAAAGAALVGFAGLVLTGRADNC